MTRVIRKEKYTCFIFGEGGKDEKVYQKLFDTDNYKYHLKKWNWNIDSASGGSAETILQQCSNEIIDMSYNLIIVFVDLDKLKMDHPVDWEIKKNKLESSNKNFKIIWQEDNLEEEILVLNPKLKGKGKWAINQWAVNNIEQLVNSRISKRVKNIFKDKEEELKSNF